MASVYLIRHGQAEFNKLNYDQLSELGHQQAKLVGSALQLKGLHANKVFYGAMRRHNETLAGSQKNWHSYGECIENANFNEFDSDEIIAKAFPHFKNKAVLGVWLATQENRKRAFQTLFSQAIERWIKGKNDDDYFENWSAFKQRVITGLRFAIEKAEGNDVAIFTSGGPISVIVQHCLDLSDEKTFELNWTIVNASISTLLYSRKNPKKISLASFNEQQHLIGKHLTYR